MSSPYGDLVEAELTSAGAEAQELSRRALTVVSTSGGLLTVLSALIGFAAANRKEAFFPSNAEGPLRIAIYFFIGAAVVALVAQLPLLVEFIDTDKMRNAVRDGWGDTESKASQEVARVRVEVLRTARRMNQIRAWLLVVAILAEVIAIGAAGIMGARVVHALAT